MVAGINHARWWTEIVEKLKSFESQTWQEIISASKAHGTGSKSHFAPTDQLIEEARNRLAELHISSFTDSVNCSVNLLQRLIVPFISRDSPMILNKNLTLPRAAIITVLSSYNGTFPSKSYSGTANFLLYLALYSTPYGLLRSRIIPPHGILLPPKQPYTFA
jgi:hypothetical protein